ncbi:hypothetical protein [uncultured Friedmanniella sp.]|uniref:hypothetical protein n=1 Tax=uncultured Friedmanniella sp. TaxID=335381 RepID=UPI0035CB18C5
MARRVALKLGDVFVVPTHEGRVGVGQVVGSGEQPQLYYLAVYEEVLPEDSSDEDVVAATQSPVLFLGLSMMAKIHRGALDDRG